ncbi:MAG: DNRLRE domain-containing protein [Eubacteriaceae bacterium]|nr:DNRLRE domain-containing protein [Eubacteriaceae bacterium]
MKNTIKRRISVLLCFTLLFTSVPVSAFADNGAEPDAGDTEIRYEEQTLSNTLILDENLSEEMAVPEESTETMTVFDLGDGKKAAVFHGSDVRYENEDGELTDYDPELVEISEEESLNGEKLEGYLYENRTGDIKQYIPRVLDEETPLLMEKEGYSIKMTPLDEARPADSAEVVKDELLTPYEEIKEENITAVYGADNDSHSYEYTSLTNGIKESVILKEKPENNVFSFRLETDGLVPVLDETANVINLTDRSDEQDEKIVAHIDRPFMNDASGNAYSEELTYSVNELEDGSYRVDLTVSRDYLDDEDRLYPVTIDPTTTWKGNSEIYDAYVISGNYADINFYKSDIRLMVAGKGIDGTYRTYMKILELKSTLEDKYVDSAYLTVYESGDCDENQTIRFNRVTENWSLTTLNWNNKPAYYTAASVNSFTTTGKQYASHKMAMTATVRNYVNSTNNPNYGIVMRNVTSTPGFAEFYGTRTSLTSYRPKLVVTYYDKPTAPSSLSISRKSGETYISSIYMKKNYNAYASWSGIASHNLADVQYKITAADDATPSPTSIGNDKVNLTAYRSIGASAASGTNVKIPYALNLPAGKYRLYIRGKDAGGMYGAAKYKNFYVDAATPSLTGVSVTPATTEANPSNNKSPKISWTASDKHFSKVTVKVTGGSEFTATTAAGEKSVTLSPSRFPEDKTYDITVKAYDKAGRTASETLQYHVDSKGPEIKSLNTEPATTPGKMTNNKNPYVNWQLGDDSISKIQLLLDGTVIYTPSDLTFRRVSISSKRFPTSGTYEFVLRVTDRAGNVTEKSVFYYVDLDEPVIDTIGITPESSSYAPAHINSPTVRWNSNDNDLSGVSYSVNGSSYITVTDTDGEFNIPSDKINEGSNSIKVRLNDKAGNVSVEKTLNYNYEPSDNYIPEIKSVTEYYGKRIIKWEQESFDSKLVSYELHRGTTSGFTPSSSTLVSSDLNEVEGIFIDKEILASGTYYYKIKVKSLSTGISFTNPYSNTESFTNAVTTDQFANTLGSKTYLDYLEAGLPTGTIHIEKSSGNMMFIQNDFSLSNSQLDYGLTRTYNSKAKRTSMFGKGWSDSYHKEIYTKGSDIYFVDSDGSSYLFKLVNGKYSCAETKDFTLTKTTGGYTIETKDKNIYTFNSFGQLVKTSEPNGCCITNEYDYLGRLKKVISTEEYFGSKELLFKYDGESLRLDYVTDHAGTKYSYDCTGNAIKKVKIDGTSGESVSYLYTYGSSSDRLETIKDGEGNVYTVVYQSDKVSSVSYPDGEKYSFTYLSGRTDVSRYVNSGGTSQKVCTLTTEFDPSSGKIKKYTDAAGNVTDYTYVSDNSFLVKTETTVKGYETLNKESGVVDIKENETITVNYTYDSHDNVLKAISSDGEESIYTYDEENNMTSEKIVNEGITTTDAEYSYDADGNVTETVDYVADTLEKHSYAQGEGNGTQSYSGRETRSTLEKIEDNNRTSGEHQITGLIEENEYVYSKNSNELNVTVKDKIKNTTSVTEEYDSMGRVVKSDENGNITLNEYDFMGRLTKSTVSHTGAETSITTYSYDDNGAVISESQSGGTTRAYSYDSRNRKVSETVTGSAMSARTSYTEYGHAFNESVSDGITGRTEAYTSTETIKDTAGNATNKRYIDIIGNTVKEVEGNRTSHYTYDRSGNCYVTYIKGSDGTSSLTLSLYDKEGNNFAEISQPEIISGKYVVGSNSIATYSDYDGRGNLISETDGNGITSAYSYDDEGRLTDCSIAGANDLTVSYEDSIGQGQITTITDANMNQKIEQRNWNNLLTEVKDAEAEPEEKSISVRTEYDSLDRKTAENFDDESCIKYEYYGTTDNLHFKRAYKNGNENSLESETEYVYDPMDRLVSAVVSKNGSITSSTEYTYDAEGKKLSEKVSNGLGSTDTISYSYDTEGRQVKTTYPSSSGLGNIEYSYAADGSLLTVKQSGKLVCEYSYNGIGQVTSVKEYKTPGTVSSYILKKYTYDSHGRCASIKYLNNGSTGSILESFEYSYDKNSMITSCTHVKNIGNCSVNETRDYVYDSHGNLIKSTITDHSSNDATAVTEYSYDAVGNRKTKSEAGENRIYEYNGLNQLIEEINETDNETCTYDYDERGNLITETDESDNITTSYTYAVTGEMTKLEKAGFTQENEYNHEGKRISRKEGGTIRRYYYDNGIPVYTKDGTSVTSANVLGADGSIIGTYRGSTYHTYLTDVQDSTESIVKSDGTLSAAYSYTDFGETAELTGSGFNNEICYTGAVYDQSSGLYYMNARYYNPAEGRFISQDSYRGELDELDQWHLYAYCANNPINYTDPSGHRKGKNKGRTSNNENKRKGYEKRQKTGDRERNVGHPNGEEHSRKAKGHPGVKQKALLIGATVSGAYLIYRGTRLLISCLPPLWWTMPANLVIP